MSAIEGAAGGANDPGGANVIGAGTRSLASGTAANRGAGTVVTPSAMTASGASGLRVGRLAAVVLWLCVGHAALGGLYWMLLNVPESNVLMLIVSALLALVIVVGAGVIDTTALVWLRPDWSLGRALGRSLRVLPAFLLALAVWLLIWWIGARLERYHELHGGELDAWLIARFDWTRTAWLHRTIDYLIGFVQFIVGTSLAVTLLWTAALESGAGVVGVRWIRRAFSWRQLVAIGLAICGLVWLPWAAVYWRPAWLPATSAEVAFAVVKLLVLGAIVQLGWALVLWAPQQSDRRR